ncbi:Alpha-D-glucose-1-phosphate phosphatase YihX [Mariniflexile rhizosphaerae]|uniref:HAD family hydrolase n=1 Tax=unclassified Mariniflexile TaxID=2643887 RepID=UPI000CB92E76|nr:HAD family phosphatase [Mariniflexile sp. TRM1-10]AXP83128.1 Alpha-D-glucose-1-phosphate phosphatase YihX [Mariniflexile sp. TRM1-10]PLB18677.1 MAG: Haloacid dehalogenase-like hydrolase [Flavobacteriaceae bacterium FS1-H7996/R]
MIKTIIFDFGNVFINLDIEGAIKRTFNEFKIDAFSEEMTAFNSFYEQGLISTEEFIEFYSENFPNLSNDELIDIWNFMLKDFPEHRLEFLKQLKATSKYKLILLSNTNELHIDWIKKQVPFYEVFKNCFDVFYLSHEINLRKPNREIFDFVLKENKLNANECLFIDDNNDNCHTAKLLGIETWHINPKTEDIANLFKIKNSLF